MKFSTFTVLFLIGAVDIDADQKLLRGGFTSSDTGGRGLQTNGPFQFPDFFETTEPPTTTENPFEFQGFGPGTPNLGGYGSQGYGSFDNFAFDFTFGSDSSQNCPSRSLTSFIFCPADGGGPVVCGPDDCEYDSVCVAERADFAEDDCVLVNSACATPASVPCPANGPSAAPSAGPSAAPSVGPSSGPSSSVGPSSGPSSAPSSAPSEFPSVSSAPSSAPNEFPSEFPSVSSAPSSAPSDSPSVGPSLTPSTSPSAGPSTSPSVFTSASPTPCLRQFEACSNDNLCCTGGCNIARNQIVGVCFG